MSRYGTVTAHGITLEPRVLAGLRPLFAQSSVHHARGKAKKAKEQGHACFLPRQIESHKGSKGCFKAGYSACRVVQSRRHISLTCDMISVLSQMILANGNQSGPNFLIPIADWLLI